jgi:hypothetical protein
VGTRAQSEKDRPCRVRFVATILSTPNGEEAHKALLLSREGSAVR